MTLAVRVIPCLDVANGRVVKGVNFQNLRDSGDPAELSLEYYHQGADELTLLDVTATLENRKTMHELVSSVAETVFIPLTVGGGISTVDDVDQLLRAGADKVSVGSAGVADPKLLAEIANRFGSQVLVLSVDAKRDISMPSGFGITTHGGRKETGIDGLAWVSQAIELGVGEVLLNSIDADGSRSGFDLAMISSFKKVCSTPLIASGGAGNPEHFSLAATAGANALLAASVFHERLFSIRDAKKSLLVAGLPVREVSDAAGGPF